MAPIAASSPSLASGRSSPPRDVAIRQRKKKKIFLELRGLGIVLHVLQQHQAQGHIANAVKPHQVDRPRNGIDAAAMRKMRTVDHAQEFVGERHILQDFIGDAVNTLGLRRGHALDAHHRIRQRRKITLVVNVEQQKVQRAALTARLYGGQCCLGLSPLLQFVQERAGCGKSLAGIARQCPGHRRTQAVIHIRVDIGW